ncbi:MAG: molybdate ABC transporter permease subunit [Solirubrobacterales bacterium]|nr:molybdate ABC transporter permease subunit [Solirubrobacterales bacterium]
MTALAHKRLAGTGFALAVGVAAAFVLVPLLALVTQISPHTALQELARPESMYALMISLGAVTCALLLIVAFGTPVAYLLARGERGPLLSALEVLFDLPLVLPPAVAGIALLAAFGEGGPIGELLAQFGLQVSFTRVAVVFALTFVAAPLYIRQAQTAFSACEPDVLESARTTGAGPMRHFMQVELPLARSGMLSGLALSGARALGEFGATMIFAGSVAGVTQTITLAIYGSLDANEDAAFALAVLLLVLTIAISVAARIYGSRPQWETR